MHRALGPAARGGRIRGVQACRALPGAGPVRRARRRTRRCRVPPADRRPRLHLHCLPDTEVSASRPCAVRSWTRRARACRVDRSSCFLRTSCSPDGRQDIFEIFDTEFGRT